MSSFETTVARVWGLGAMFFVGWVPFTSLHVKPAKLQGRVALVTGSNTGIGYECAVKLASYGATVYLLCRSTEKAEEARKQIVAKTGNQDVKVALVDMSSLASVKRFVDSWDSRHKVDILINNAGIFPHEFLKTEDGHEMCFQSNLLAHLQLTLGLLPYMADHARIVNVSSYAQYHLGEQLLDPNDIDSFKVLEGTLKLQQGQKMARPTCSLLYSKSKLAQVVFTRQLQQRLDASNEYSKKNIVVHACHPGMSPSQIFCRRC